MPRPPTLSVDEGSATREGAARRGEVPLRPSQGLNPSSLHSEATDPYAVPSDRRRWVPVASLHLPLASSTLEDILDLLSADLPGRRLVVRVSSDDPEELEVGYWTIIEL